MVQSLIPREISLDRSKSKSSANTLTRKVIVSIPPPQRHSLRPRNQCGSASSGLPASPSTQASGAGEEGWRSVRPGSGAPKERKETFRGAS